MSTKKRKHKRNFHDPEPCAGNFKNKKLNPKNTKQKEYLNAIDNFNIIVSTGVSGSGKTYIAARKAAKLLMDNTSSIEKIVIARPAEGVGKSIGLLPGSKEEKLAGWCAPVLEALEEELGAHNVEHFIDYGRIELLPLEQVKGRTFNNTVVICDEGEDMDVAVVKSLVLRHGKGSKTIINGDVLQQDLKRESGLTYILELLAKFDNLPVVHVDFDEWKYCVRSDEARIMVEAIYMDEHGGIK